MSAGLHARQSGPRASAPQSTDHLEIEYHPLLDRGAHPCYASAMTPIQSTATLSRSPWSHHPQCHKMFQQWRQMSHRCRVDVTVWNARPNLKSRNVTDMLHVLEESTSAATCPVIPAEGEIHRGRERLGPLRTTALAACRNIVAGPSPFCRISVAKVLQIC